MNQLTHDDLNVPGLCASQRKALRALIGAGPFAPRAAAEAYIKAGNPWTDIPRAYAAMARAGRLPESDLVWRIARIAFREASRIDRLSHLAQYAETLDASTWLDARTAAYTAFIDVTAYPTLDDAYAAADNNTVYTAAYAAYYAAYAAADDAAHDAASYAAIAAAYAAAYTAATVYADADARNRVRDEIVELVLDTVEGLD